jgi:hypothetical protein
MCVGAWIWALERLRKQQIDQRTSRSNKLLILEDLPALPSLHHHDSVVCPPPPMIVRLF